MKQDPISRSPDVLAEPSGTAASLFSRAVVLGAVLGVDAIGHCVALAALVFSGTLASAQGTGTALFLASTLVCTLMLIRFSGIAGALGIAQDATVAIVATLAVAVANAMTGPAETRLATTLAIIGLSTFATGLVLFFLGRFGLGRVARLMPYPVAVGFLASSGWLLTSAALTLITGATGFSDLRIRLASPEMLPILWPAIALATTLLIVVRVWSGATAVLVVLGLFLVGFHISLLAVGMDIAAARHMGLLPLVAGDTRSISLGPELIGMVDWGIALQTAPALGVVVIVNVVGFMLSTTGVELATRGDLDMNRELRVTGAANLLTGLFGGLTGFLSTGSTLLAQRLGVRHPAMPVAYALVIVGSIAFAGRVVEQVPQFMTAGLLLFIGLSLLQDWLVATRSHLILQDWLVAVFIVLLSMAFGIFVAMAAGLLVAIGVFVLNYASIPVLVSDVVRSPRRSIVDRAPEEAQLLRETWDEVFLARLQGYLFFGSVERLLDELRALPPSGRPSQHLILDLSRVSGVDSSACAALQKLAYLATRRKLGIVVCSVSDEILRVTERWMTDFFPNIGFVRCQDLDQALEAVETAILAQYPEIGSPGDGLARLLEAYGQGHPRLPELRALLVPSKLEVGATLILAGAGAKDIYIVESGRLGVFLPGGAGTTSQATGLRRVRSMTAGAVVGEMARYLAVPRTATIVAEAASSIWTLPDDTLARLDRDDRDLAALVHAIMARALSEKLSRTNLLLPAGGD